MKLSLIKEPDILLLAAVAERPTYGYELRLFFPSVGCSSLYHRLHKLEQLRLVRSRVRTNQMAPQRHIYTLTPRGREFLKTGFHLYLREKAEQARTLLSDYRALQQSFYQLAAFKAARLGDSRSRGPSK